MKHFAHQTYAIHIVSLLNYCSFIFKRRSVIFWYIFDKVFQQGIYKIYIKALSPALDPTLNFVVGTQRDQKQYEPNP